MDAVEFFKTVNRIYHEHIFEGAIYRGTRCRLEQEG